MLISDIADTDFMSFIVGSNPDKIKLLLELYDKIHHMEEHILNLEWRIIALEKQK